MPFPRFNSKKAWKDNAQREWIPAGCLPAFEELNNFTGTPWYILDHQSDFPSEDDVVDLVRKDVQTAKVQKLAPAAHHFMQAEPKRVREGGTEQGGKHLKTSVSRTTDVQKRVKVLSFLSWSTNGFKCLVLISEV